MGVWTFVNIVDKKESENRIVKGTGIPKGDELFRLVDLVYDESYRRTLMANSRKLDLSFFLKCDSSAYGESKYHNLVFEPESVIETLNLIKSVFQSFEGTISRHLGKNELKDIKGNDLCTFFIRSPDDSNFGNDYQYARLLKGNPLKINLGYDNDYKLVEIQFDKSLPELRYAVIEDGEMVPGEHIELSKDEISFREVKHEIEKIREQAEYAKMNGFYLQVSQS